MMEWMMMIVDSISSNAITIPTIRKDPNIEYLDEEESDDQVESNSINESQLRMMMRDNPKSRWRSGSIIIEF